MDDEEQQLLQQALDQFYEEILNFMFLRVNHREDAEDLTQDTFMKAAHSMNSYRGDASLRTWIFVIARRTLADAYQQKSRKQGLWQKLKYQFNFRKQKKQDEQVIILFQLLDQLSESDREVVILKHYFGFSYKDIAKITGWSVNNIGVRLTRAVSRLQSFSEKDDEI